MRCYYGSMCWDGSYECDASDCPDQPGGSVEINYNSDTPIAGFQFNVDGVDVTGAYGGAAGAAGFTVSNSATTVIGFSLTGATIPAGEGVLVVLDVVGDASAACLSDIVISDSSGSALETTGDCTTIVIDAVDDNVYGCTDMDACNYNGDATADDGSCDYGSMCWDDQECMEADGEAPGQCGTTGAARMAEEAGVKKLILVHMGAHIAQHGPLEKGLGDIREVYGGQVIYAEELMAIDV